MVTGYRNQDSEVMGLLNACDWYFLPVANPDGYVYSHKQGVREQLQTSRLILPFAINKLS